jgi:hypothetical protein
VTVETGHDRNHLHRLLLLLPADLVVQQLPLHLLNRLRNIQMSEFTQDTAVQAKQYLPHAHAPRARALLAHATECLRGPVPYQAHRARDLKMATCRMRGLLTSARGPEQSTQR